MTKPPLALFQGFGIELEYMLVATPTLDILPKVDELIRAVTGRYDSDADRGPLAWSNELVAHVLELKTNGPASRLAPLPPVFQAEIREINRLLAGFQARLMPAAMHPWMNPALETRLWPHDYSEVYQAFHRIFNCHRHGWANLQSVHLNLPFANDQEFARLHAAIRLVLPILPALAASSPVQEGRLTGYLDTRLHHYRFNSCRFPSITGQVIPEPIFRPADYQRDILQPIYRDIAPVDPDAVLQDEFLNARGAIARFQRNTIEVRLLDIQECPQADLAITALVIALLRHLASEHPSSLQEQQACPTSQLEAILLATIQQADQTLIDDPSYLRLLGLPSPGPLTALQLWQHLAETSALRLTTDSPPWHRPLQTIFQHGCLARRILRALGPEPGPDKLKEVYGELCRCLEEGVMFLP